MNLECPSTTHRYTPITSAWWVGCLFSENITFIICRVQGALFLSEQQGINTPGTTGNCSTKGPQIVVPETPTQHTEVYSWSTLPITLQGPMYLPNGPLCPEAISRVQKSSQYPEAPAWNILPMDLPRPCLSSTSTPLCPEVPSSAQKLHVVHISPCTHQGLHPEAIAPHALHSDPTKGPEVPRWYSHIEHRVCGL
jgi:hypothetical protein